jgi:NADH:quinone reductase (non-electrogenic)
MADNSLRFSVFLQWAWTYLIGKRGAPLIIRQRINGDERSLFH